jgi:hypothetical protein
MAIDTFSETCLIAIAAASGSDVKFQALTETVDIDIGDKDFDVITTMAGGRLVKFTPQEPTTITFEAYPMEAGTATGTTGTGFFDMLNTVDTSQPLSVSVDRVRSKYRVVVMWTDSTSVTDATGQIVAPTNRALRVCAADGFFVSCKPSFTDGILKFTVKYKVPPFDSSGTANIKIESVYSASATATMASLNSYTVSTKF